MKGNDIKATGVKPAFVLTNSKPQLKVALSSFGNKKQVEQQE
jgi:hypothetical protein